MTKATRDPGRLSRLPPQEDPHGLAPLFQSAKVMPVEDLPRLGWRLRSTLRYQATRPRRLLRLALTTGLVFITGGTVGAALLSSWRHKSVVTHTNVEPSPTTSTQPARTKRVAHTTETPPAEQAAPTIELPLAAADVEPAPTAPSRPLSKPNPRNVIPPAPIPIPDVPAEVPPPVALPSTLAMEQALLGDILKSLRKQRDPQAALDLLDDHAQRFPDTVLAPEVAMLRVEALLGLGRNAEALAILDHFALGSIPNREERLVLRGELRAGAKRWLEARADFEPLLSNLSTATPGTKSRDLKERALWGRASARSHLGDEVGARADLAFYLRLFPEGRFARQATALLRETP